MPNRASDTAFFDLSNTTSLSISANTEVNGIVFDSNASFNPFTVTANPTFTLTISGVGITNNSGATQAFVTDVDASGSFGTIVFSNSASAGTNVVLGNNGQSLVGLGGQTLFKDTSTAGNAGIFNNGGSTVFLNRSTAGSATIDSFGGALRNS